MGTRKVDVIFNPLSSERFVVTISRNSKLYPICQIIFQSSDSSLFVNFPYLKESRGLVSKLTLPANFESPGKLSFQPGGKVTSHLVKYSHHTDGRVHFSQDKKVYTEIIKQSIALNSYSGHIFTLGVVNLSDFSEATSQRYQNHWSRKRSVINFNMGEEEEMQQYKIVGHWYHIVDVANRIKQDDTTTVLNIGQLMTIQIKDNGYRKVFVLSPLTEKPLSDHALLLRCERVLDEKDPDPRGFYFIGGFDHANVVNDHNLETSFLGALYPCDDYEQLLSKLGSIDLVEPL